MLELKFIAYNGHHEVSFELWAADGDNVGLCRNIQPKLHWQFQSFENELFYELRVNKGISFQVHLHEWASLFVEILWIDEDV